MISSSLSLLSFQQQRLRSSSSSPNLLLLVVVGWICIIIVLSSSSKSLSSVQAFIVSPTNTKRTTSRRRGSKILSSSTTSQRKKPNQNQNRRGCSLQYLYYQDGDNNGTTEDYHYQSSSSSLSSYDDLYNSYSLEEYERRKNTEKIANSFLKSSRLSFKNMESGVDGLLENSPLVAMGIFVGCGLLVAYLTGFFLLDGYIENINPARNGHMPDWDEGILIIEPSKQNVGSV